MKFSGTAHTRLFEGEGHVLIASELFDVSIAFWSLVFMQYFWLKISGLVWVCGKQEYSLPPPLPPAPVVGEKQTYMRYATSVLSTLTFTVFVIHKHILTLSEVPFYSTTIISQE